QMWAVMRGVILSSALFCSVSHAAEAQDRRARQLYADGESQFRQQHYQAAYDLFRQAYLLSPVPALRYDMAGALQGLGRPHDAAEELRAYLRLKLNDPDKALLEERIQGLEEAQRLLDSDKKPPPVPGLPSAPTRPFASERGPRKRTLGALLSTVGAI